MGFVENINRAFFNLTYNEKASQAYDEQNEKAAGAVEEVKKQIDGYRKKRDSIIAANESTDYFSSNSISRITEWENWLSKNSGLASGDYTKKSTEMKTEWESLLNVNKVVKEMNRIPAFLDLYMKDKDLKIPTAERKELEALKKEAEEYYTKIVKRTPADIVAKRDEFNRKFEAIQKKIPENFENLNTKNTGATSTAPNLLNGIQESNFNRYKKQIEGKELAEQETFSLSRLFSRTGNYFVRGLSMVQNYFFGLILTVLIMNDAIGRPVLYRIFYGIYMFLLCIFPVAPLIGPFFPYLALGYYFYRAAAAFQLKNFFSGEGPLMDYVSAPVLFALFPLFEAQSTLSKILPIFHYNTTWYDNVVQKKRDAYEKQAASLVGKVFNPSTSVIPVVAVENVNLKT